MTAQPQRIGFLLWPATPRADAIACRGSPAGGPAVAPRGALRAAVPARRSAGRRGRAGACRERPGTAGWSNARGCSWSPTRRRRRCRQRWAWRSSNWRVRERRSARCPPASTRWPSSACSTAIAPRCTGVGTMTSPSASPRSSPPITCSSGIATARPPAAAWRYSTCCWRCCPATMALNWPARSRKSWWWSAFAKATSASASR